MKFRTLFTVLMLIVSSFCFGHQKMDDVQLQQIINNHHTCVKEFSENKIYLQEKNILPMQNGLILMLNDEGDYIRLPELFSDCTGCFVTVSYADSLQIFNICPGCGLEYFITCRNENCPLKKKK